MSLFSVIMSACTRLYVKRVKRTSMKYASVLMHYGQVRALHKDLALHVGSFGVVHLQLWCMFFELPHGISNKAKGSTVV